MAGFFEWDPSFEVGIPIVDEQHKELLVYGKKFSEMIASGGVGLDVDMVITTFTTFRDSLGFHFYSEEKVMEEIKYNNLGAHRRQHNEILEQVMSYNPDKIKADPIFALTEIRSMLQGILYDHILEMDSTLGRAYRRYVKLFKHMEDAKRKLREDTEKKFGMLVRELDVTNCYLHWEQRQKGHCVLVAKEKHANLVKLSTLEKNTLMAELYRLILIISKTFQPADVQVIYAGDVDKQLAIHVIPKYEGTDLFGKVYDKPDEIENLSEDDYRQLIEQINANF